MNVKFVFTLVALCFVSLSFGQDYENNTKSLKEFDSKIEAGSYDQDNSIKADKLILETSEQHVGLKDIGMIDSNEEEWIEIRKQIVLSKERVTKSNEVYLSKVIDTVYILLPTINNNKTQLSGW